MSESVGLVVGTRGPRTAQLARLLRSLEDGAVPPWTVVIVDQNERETPVAQVIAEVGPTFEVVHLHTPDERGLSRARNRGLALLLERRIEVLGFPDDDCWYDHDTLTTVAGAFASDPRLDGVTGRGLDEQGRSAIEWAPEGVLLHRRNIWRRHISIGVFVRLDAAARVGAFDEGLGVGADTPWQSGEETDFLLRLLALGGSVRYEPDLVVRHALADRGDLRRRRQYGRGMGRLLRRHYSPPEGFARAVAPMRHAWRADRRGAAWAETLGRLEGLFGRTLGRQRDA